MRPEWKQIGRVTNRFLPAGPATSEVTARAAVVRVRSAAEWAAANAPRFPFPAPIQASSLLVVDRHGLITAITGSLARAGNAAGGAAQRVPQAARSSITLRQLAEFLPFAYSVDGSKVKQVLVAPNVWEASRKARLDQRDYARLVATRAALWGSLLTASPWLANRIMTAAMELPDSAEPLMRLTALFHELVETQLTTFTPRVIPSINWLRMHEPDTFARSLLLLPGVDSAELTAARSNAQRFVPAVDLLGRPRALWALLQDPTNFPTDAEITDPAIWLARLGYAT